MTNGAFKVGVALPSFHIWEAEFGLSLSQACMHMMQRGVAGYHGTHIHVMNKRGSILPSLRYQLVKDARTLGCTHLLFVDSDQVWPLDTIHTLAKHHKMIVGCNVATKVMPPETAPTARKRSDTNPFGEIVFTRMESTGLEKVWRLGFGIMLIDMRVFDKIPRPYFNIVWRDDYDQHMGEDWYFCEEAEKAGFDIWVDHDLSKKIGHVGPVTFTHDMIFPDLVTDRREKFLAAQRPSKPNLRAISPAGSA